MTDQTTDQAVRPEPVLEEGKVAGLLGGFVVAVVALVLLVIRGQASDLSLLQLAVEGVLSAGMAVVAFVAPIWRAWKARAKTTPLESPQNAEGVPLVPVSGSPSGYRVVPQVPGKADHGDPTDL